MTPARAASDTAALPPSPVESSPSSGASATGPGEGDAPNTPEEAARKFEEVLVRQFTKVMTDDMFSSSLSGKGGGNWMESQRDRQRDWMTDLITEQLVNSNSLGISETLTQKWGAAGSTAEPDAASPTSVDPALPDESADPSSPFLDTPPATPNESKIDHAV
jgi:flagellar protein FlgJ